MTLVSKNGLSFIELFAIEFEIRREGPLHLTELLECPLFGPVTGHFEVAFTCDGDRDFVSLFEIERFDNHGGKTHSQTVAPFRNLQRIYLTCCISTQASKHPVACGRGRHFSIARRNPGKPPVP
jgi:hypothetical protein